MPEDKRKPFTSWPKAYGPLMAVAIVAGLFCLVVSVLLIANYLQIKAIAPLDQPELLKLREQYAEAPEADPELVGQIRAMDLLARKAFFTSQAHLRMGGYLLLGGMVVFLAALKLAARSSVRPPVPGAEADDDEAYWTSRARMRELIAFSSVVVATIALLTAYLTPLDFPTPGSPAPEDMVTAQGDETPAPAEEGETPETSEAAFPDWEAIQRQWPSFRGPGSYGVAFYDTAPAEWDMESGKNIAWKVEVPLPGYSSPVVWDKQVFVSGATAEAREIYCYDGDTGELRWKYALESFPGTPAEAPKVSQDTGYAASTMAVHGHLAFAIFANGDLACCDFEGNLQWGRNLGMPENHYGHSSSLIAFGKHLFVQFDDKRAPRLMALDAATGEEAWSVKRTEISWASPTLIETPAGFQLILDSETLVDAYDPETGRHLWGVEALDGEVAPSPAYVANTVFVANEYAMASAIRLTFEGAETTSELIWEWDEYLPDVSSPVGAGDHFYIATSMGEIVCIALEDGENVWTEEYDRGFYASPIVVGNRIYALDLKGTMQIFKAGAPYELIGTPKLGEDAFATPAFLDGRIYARTEKHLVCIEENDGH